MDSVQYRDFNNAYFTLLILFVFVGIKKFSHELFYYCFLLSNLPLIVIPYSVVAILQCSYNTTEVRPPLYILGSGFIFCDFTNLMICMWEFEIYMLTTVVTISLKILCLLFYSCTLCRYTNPVGPSIVPIRYEVQQTERLLVNRLHEVTAEANRIATQVMGLNRNRAGNEGLESAVTRSYASQLGEAIEEIVALEPPDAKNNYISVPELLADLENSNRFVLGLLAKTAQDTGIHCFIEKVPSDPRVNDACLHFLTAGKMRARKADFIFDFGLHRNNEILTRQRVQRKFRSEWHRKITEFLACSPNDVEIRSVTRSDGKLKVAVGFLQPVAHNALQPFLRANNPSLLDIVSRPMMRACKLSLDCVPSKYDQADWPSEPLRRGNEPYHPPYGWKGCALQVEGKYDGGNDDWLEMNGIQGEWAVAYHGMCHNPKSTFEHVVICGEGLKEGQRQLYKDSQDSRHPGQTSGCGVYVSPWIDIAEKYTSVVSFTAANGINRYKLAFMCRVNPREIRQPTDEPKYWILRHEDIRPYRLLHKKVP